MSSELCTTEPRNQSDSACRDNVLYPAADIIERQDSFLVVYDMPGATPGGIDISFESNELTVVGSVDRGGQRVGAYKRTMCFEDSIDVEKVSADFTDGVLTVALPKRQAVRIKV